MEGNCKFIEQANSSEQATGSCPPAGGWTRGLQHVKNSLLRNVTQILGIGELLRTR
jgi:hypothetical protein